MKKLLLLLAMAVMVIGLVAGCGKSADNGGGKKIRHHRLLCFHIEQPILRNYEGRR